MEFIKAENLTKSFNGKKVLNNLSCSFNKGQTSVIIGNSGSGKTTFLRILNFLETLDGGKVFLNGREFISEQKLSFEEKKERRKNFGLIFQSFNLFPQYTVKENVLLPLKIALKEKAGEGISENNIFKKHKAYKERYAFLLKEEEKKVDSLLLSLKLKDKADSYPGMLSGGESQRVAIARALVLDPQVICFDEPTSSLDPLLKDEVAKNILQLKKEGRTMIIVTHEIEFASKIADQVLFMENGIIKESGDKNILLAPSGNELKAFLSLGTEKEN